MISQHYFTFPFQIPRVIGQIRNWPLYLSNYLLRRKQPAEYEMRNGFRLIDGRGTLAGTIAVPAPGPPGPAGFLDPPDFDQLVMPGRYGASDQPGGPYPPGYCCC